MVLHGTFSDKEMVIVFYIQYVMEQAEEPLRNNEYWKRLKNAL